METAYEFKVVLVPGSWFEVADEVEPLTKSTEVFFRGTYAATSVEVLEEGIENFGKAIRKAFKMT
jgi:aromatic amino acid aminotransferase I